MKLFYSLIEPKQQIPDERKLFTNSMLKAMIVPLLIEQLLQMIVGLADTMMVSHAGEAVVAGVGLDTMIYTIFIYLFTAISAGGSVVVAQYIGSKDRENGNLAASQIFHLSGVLSLFCMVVMLLFGSDLLHLIYPSTEPETMAACETYMWIVSLSFPANAVYNAGAALYRTMGRTSVTMKVSLVANIINVIGNAIGIFVLHAGAAGVAWPTSISWYTAAAVMTWLCFRRNQEVRIEWKHMLRLNGSMAKRILGVAIPNSVEKYTIPGRKSRAWNAGGHLRHFSDCGKHHGSDLLVSGCLHGHLHGNGVHHGDRTMRRRGRYGSCRMVYAEADAAFHCACLDLEYHRHDLDTAASAAV